MNVFRDTAVSRKVVQLKSIKAYATIPKGMMGCSCSAVASSSQVDEFSARWNTCLHVLKETKWILSFQRVYLKLLSIFQTTFRHCRVRFYAFFGQPLSKQLHIFSSDGFELITRRVLMRPSHGKLKLANSCWKTSKCWQTRAFTRQTRVKSQHTLNLQHGRRGALALVFCVFVCCRRKVPQIRTILNFLDELKSCLTIVFTSVRHFLKYHANHVNRARVLIG